jgi:hypothetical protein
MVFKDWIDLSTALGTVAATLVAAYSANLAWRQVRLQFEPRLLIPNQLFQIGVSADALTHLCWQEPIEEARYVNGGSTDYSLTVTNVGNGPAHNLQIHWMFDFESTYADVMEKIGTYLPQMTVEHDHFGCAVKIYGRTECGWRLPDEAFGVIDFLQGMKDKRDAQTCIIDPSIGFFVGCYAYFQMVAHQIDERAQAPATINVVLRISYVSSAGKRAIEDYPIVVEVRGGQYRTDLSEGVAFVAIFSDGVRKA